MKKLSFIVLLSVFISCHKKKEVWSETFEITNNLGVDRFFETVSINISEIPLQKYSITDLETNQKLIYQLVDTDLDGSYNELLFQPKVKADSSKKYYLTVSENENDSLPLRCFSRFVPERTDDYAWENNRVAFRTFGPTAQQMVEEGVNGGTLSSGIDAWLKRVEYPIINKWYEKNKTGTGSYHEDTGEGLDNFHVGISRGIGGIALEADSNYYFSKNFVDYKTITIGPIRTSFELTYATWNANGKQIAEKKLISLDYGQNLSRFEIHLKGTDTILAGITLHNKNGQTTQNKNWISYWEPFFDSELGQGLVTTDLYFINSNRYETEKKDLSNLYANLKVVDGKVVYYAGFGWKKSKQFENQLSWENYLKDFALKLENPLIVKKL